MLVVPIPNGEGDNCANQKTQEQPRRKQFFSVLFGKAHMNANYISQPSLDALMKPQSLTDGQSTNYGIGWRTYTDNQGIQWVGHSGGSVGGTTIFIMNKEEDMIIAITGNRSSIRYGSLHFDLAHLFLK